MRLFTDVMREVRSGRLVDHASRLLNEVANAVRETGKAGSVTVQLKIKPGKEEGEYDIIPVVTIKRPEPDIREAIFFINEAGDLVRTDPRQSEMPLGDELAQRRGQSAAAGT